MEGVCSTLEGALEKAIDQDGEGFETYCQGAKTVKNPSARKILKELALEENDVS